MKALKVLRFVFLFVGLAILGLGITMINGNVEGNPFVAIFGVILLVSFGGAFIFIGGGLIALGIAFFIIYAVKSKKKTIEKPAEPQK